MGLRKPPCRPGSPDFWRRPARPVMTLAPHISFRHYWELCALLGLRDGLRSGDVFVPGSRRYADPSTYLYPPGQWELQREAYCKLVGEPAKAADALAQGKEELHAALAELEKILAGALPDDIGAADQHRRCGLGRIALRPLACSPEIERTFTADARVVAEASDRHAGRPHRPPSRKDRVRPPHQGLSPTATPGTGRRASPSAWPCSTAMRAHHSRELRASRPTPCAPRCCWRRRSGTRRRRSPPPWRACRAGRRWPGRRRRCSRRCRSPRPG